MLRRLETRLIVLRDTNAFVYGASYRWRPDLSDADLVSTGLTETILIGTASGMRTQQWFLPPAGRTASAATQPLLRRLALA